MKNKQSTALNKIFALGLVACSIIPSVIEGNCAASILMFIIALPLFLSKENHVLL